MFTGTGLVFLLILCVVLIIILVNYVNLYPFFAIIAAAYAFAILGGVLLKDLDNVIRGGFGSLLPGLGLDFEMGRFLTVMAIGAGAMTVSHSNDSYFRVVAEISGFDTATAYKTYTAASLYCFDFLQFAGNMLRNLKGEK